MQACTKLYIIQEGNKLESYPLHDFTSFQHKDVESTSHENFPAQELF